MDPHPFSSRYSCDALQRDHFPPVEDAFSAYHGPSHYLPLHTPRAASLDMSLTALSPMSFSVPSAFEIHQRSYDSSGSATPLRVLERPATSPLPLSPAMAHATPKSSPAVRLYFTTPPVAPHNTYHNRKGCSHAATQTDDDRCTTAVISSGSQTTVEEELPLGLPGHGGRVEALLNDVLRELIAAREKAVRETEGSHRVRFSASPTPQVAVAASGYCSCTSDLHMGILLNRERSKMYSSSPTTYGSPMASVAMDRSSYRTPYRSPSYYAGGY